MDLTTHVQSYYDALRTGAQLESYFIDRDGVVKFGIHEHRWGYDDVVAGLSAQTEGTTDWSITSHSLCTGTRDDTGWFSDLVTMGWTDTVQETSYKLDTRWSGTAVGIDEGNWAFTGMHVSVPYAYDDPDRAVDEHWIEN